MRRQARPFVEVKHKRAPSKKQSIWGNLNIAAAAETMHDLEQDELASGFLIDSDAASIDVAGDDSPPVEHIMPDPQETEITEARAEAPAAIATPEPKKKASRQKKTKAAPKPRIAKHEAVKPVSRAADPEPASARGRRKTYSQNERAEILAKIEKSVGRGGSIKAAVAVVGVSEQTYYQWKKAAEIAAPTDDLKDLLALEEENKRLKRQLAERLRQENAELKKKLGLK